MLADVVVVDSRDAALEAIRANIPDVLLLSALLSPRDEDELIAHLRTVNAQHLQTHTIPQLASSHSPGEKRGGRGLLSAFRRKKDQEPVVVNGCDPDLFAEEITTYLQRAEAKKRELQDANSTVPDMRLGPISQRSATAASAAPEPEASNSSSWDDPFAWKPTSSTRTSHAPAPHSAPEHSEPAPADSTHVEPFVPESIGEPLVEPFAAASPLSVDEPLVVAEPAGSVTEPLISQPLTTHEPLISPDVVARAHPPDEIDRPAGAAPDAHQSVVVAGEPSLLISQPYSVMVTGAEAEPEAAYQPEPLFTKPEPKHTVIDPGDADLPEFTLVEDAVETAAPLRRPHAAAAIDAAAETLINLDAEPYDASLEEPRTYARSDDTPREDSGEAASPVSEWSFAIADMAAVVDQGSGSQRLGPLATWARMEARGNDAPSTSDDLRMLLGSLAVPPAVAGVRYPRGCRIRRVRVPASKTPDNGDSVGPVILSRRALADQREQTV